MNTYTAYIPFTALPYKQTHTDTHTQQQLISEVRAAGAMTDVSMASTACIRSFQTPTRFATDSQAFTLDEP